MGKKNVFFFSCLHLSFRAKYFLFKIFQTHTFFCYIQPYSGYLHKNLKSPKAQKSCSIAVSP